MTYVSVDSTVGTYVSAINHGTATEILWFRTYVPGSNPHDDNYFFFINLVKMYWTSNSVYRQFEYQYPKSSNVSGRACAVIEGGVWSRRNEGNVSILRS